MGQEWKVECRQGRVRTRPSEACRVLPSSTGETQDQEALPGPTSSLPYTLSPSGNVTPIPLHFAYFFHYEVSNLASFLWATGSLSTNTSPLSFQSNLCIRPSMCENTVDGLRLSVPSGSCGHLYTQLSEDTPSLTHVFFHSFNTRIMLVHWTRCRECTDELCLRSSSIC